MTVFKEFKMHSILVVLVFLPHLIYAQCNDLQLDWATYSAVPDKNQICKYSNVRFGAPPVGNLRFREPQSPSPKDPRSPAGPISCPQILPQARKSCRPKTINEGDEDCLFLDIYVPVSAFKVKAAVSVVVWFYGGDYLFGSKESFNLTEIPLYSGQGIIESSSEPVIFVAGNYRLGAFGWLAGSHMEENALPNAGLHDQRKILEFVRDNIRQLNGDPSLISLWGESAGGGSIIHHLVAKDGQQDPLFTKAILQSPAYEWHWDQRGILNDTYTAFARLAHCENGSITCLQSATQGDLKAANKRLVDTGIARERVLALGPAIDGKYITTLPAVAFSQGKYWHNLSSLVVSHVSYEVPKDSDFVPLPKKATPEDFDRFLLAFMPSDQLAPLRKRIKSQYRELDQRKRAAQVIRDSMFTCNTRQLFEAYDRLDKPVYMINYDFLGEAPLKLALHTSDLFPTFSNKDINMRALIHDHLHSGFKEWFLKPLAHYLQFEFAPAYQSYLKSHAIHGDPNINPQGLARKLTWPKAYVQPAHQDPHQYVQNVLEPYYPTKVFRDQGNAPFRLVADKITAKATCDFWANLASELIGIVGSAEEEPFLIAPDAQSQPQLEL